MDITRLFDFMQKIWLSLVTVSKPFFEWLTTQLDVIDMTPFEFIFSAGIILILVKAIIKFIV